MDKKIDVVIGATVVRKSAYAFDKFMKNQKEIQDIYPQSRLVLATDEPDYEEELKGILKIHGVEGDVIVYKTEKPDHFTNRIWSIACGREAIRKYALSTGADYLLPVDADMIHDPLVIDILKRELAGYDVVQSGYRYRVKELHTVGFGAGCSLVKKEMFEKLKFGCYEFKHDQWIDDGLVFESDLVRLGARIKKGIFVRIEHYYTSNDFILTEPRDLTLFEKIRTNPRFRWILITLSIKLKFDAAGFLWKLINGPSRTKYKVTN